MEFSFVSARVTEEERLDEYLIYLGFEFVPVCLMFESIPVRVHTSLKMTGYRRRERKSSGEESARSKRRTSSKRNSIRRRGKHLEPSIGQQVFF